MWNANVKNCYQEWTVQYWVLMYKALSVWEADPANNKGTRRLPTHRTAFNIACSVAVMRYVRCVTWFEWTWIYRNCRRFTMVFTGVLVPFWCKAIYSHHNGIAWAVRFTHNGHHHCKRTSPPAIRKLKVCRPADIFPALFPTCVQLFNNWRVGMVVTVGLASADLQPPWWRGPVGSHDDFIKWKPFPRYWPFVCVCVCVCVWGGGGGGGGVTSDRWIRLTKASDAEFWCFLWSVPE